jgi:putative restriction endonuclease
VPSVDEERQARLDAWAEVSPLSTSGTLDAAAVNAARAGGLRLFYGGRGIWTDKARTSSLADDGVTVGVLHTGRSYADDLLPDGIVYHYPRSDTPGRDAQEVNATKAARELEMPLFVVVQPDSTSRRVVHLGWVEDSDDEGELFLITFGEVPIPPLPSRQDEDEAPFELERTDGVRRRTASTARPGQHRFSFRVFRRYGIGCAVCDVSVMGLLDAAHLRAYRDRGSDDPRNGLVLCATHHRAYDKRLFAIDPKTRKLVFRDTRIGASELGITRTSITHLRAQPHYEALAWCWSKFEPPA